YRKCDNDWFIKRAAVGMTAARLIYVRSIVMTDGGWTAVETQSAYLRHDRPEGGPEPGTPIKGTLIRAIEVA
ncbi:MAG: hypothetical protein K2J06_03060, partial [Muribaculaceae bacterium]|nr:hypothetical protein [Muribaculaceae bacterium]